MRKFDIKLVSLLTLLLLAAVLAVGCGGGAEEGAEGQAEEFKVGFVYVGSPGDGGFT